MLPAADKKNRNTFRKRDRLKSSIEIEALYRENQSIVSYPLKCYYSFSNANDNKPAVRVAFAVPKKTFKHAVERNSLKRRMREAYRLNAKNIFESFMNQKDKQLKLFFIYVGKEILDYVEIEKALKGVLNRLIVDKVKD